MRSVKIVVAEVMPPGQAVAEEVFAGAWIAESDVKGEKWLLYVHAWPPDRRALVGCSVLLLDGEQVGWLHGTDCNLSRFLAHDIVSGSPGSGDLPGCARMEEGGRFAAIELRDHLGRAGRGFKLGKML